MNQKIVEAVEDVHKVTQEQINATIKQLNSKFVSNIVLACKNDRAGAFLASENYFDCAEKIEFRSHNLLTTCEEKNLDLVNKNAPKEVCPVERGIGNWQIERSPNDCEILFISGGQGPPPWGEFAICEFPINEVTKPIGPVDYNSCSI